MYLSFEKPLACLPWPKIQYIVMYTNVMFVSIKEYLVSANIESGWDNRCTLRIVE